MMHCNQLGKPLRIQIQALFRKAINSKHRDYSWSSISPSPFTTGWEIHRHRHPHLRQHFHQRTARLCLRTILWRIGTPLQGSRLGGSGHQMTWEMVLNKNAKLVCSMEELQFFGISICFQLPLDRWRLQTPPNQRQRLGSTRSPWRPCWVGWPASSSSSSSSASSFSVF